MSAALPFPHSHRLPCLTYCHQPPQHLPRRQTHRSAGGRCFSHRGFASPSQTRQSVVAESCSFLLCLLRSVRFHSLLPTPPRGDAVTSSSQPGCVRSWPESPTLEGVDALRRTRVDISVHLPMNRESEVRIAHLFLSPSAQRQKCRCSLSGTRCLNLMGLSRSGSESHNISAPRRASGTAPDER